MPWTLDLARRWRRRRVLLRLRLRLLLWSRSLEPVALGVGQGVHLERVRGVG